MVSGQWSVVRCSMRVPAPGMAVDGIRLLRRTRDSSGLSVVAHYLNCCQWSVVRCQWPAWRGNRPSGERAGLVGPWALETLALQRLAIPADSLERRRLRYEFMMRKAGRQEGWRLRTPSFWILRRSKSFEDIQVARFLSEWRRTTKFEHAQFCKGDDLHQCTDARRFPPESQKVLQIGRPVGCRANSGSSFGTSRSDFDVVACGKSRVCETTDR